MSVAPFGETGIAKLTAASADHMVASLRSLYEHFALRASLPIFEDILKILLTTSAMLNELAFLTILCPTFIALIFIFEFVNNAITLIRRT